MLHFIPLRVAFSVVMAGALLPAATFAQSQDSQSVAEAARRAREQKKAAAKPAPVITNDDVKPAAPAAPDSAPVPGAQAPSAAGAANSPAGQAPADSAAPDPKDEKTSKEIAELKEQIKQAQSDVDVLLRQLSLEQDNYLSKPDYLHDTAGKAKVDGIKQQANDKQQELDRLKARLAELQPLPTVAAPAPPKA
jgi:hypothetical protein